MGSKELGDLGEKHAARSLALKGYSIIARKFRCRFGEIDIIALDKGTLVFIEVRSRSDDEYGLPYETINLRITKSASSEFAFSSLTPSDVTTIFSSST